MRIVFLGTPDFAAYSLQALIEADMDVVATITAPDKKAGRGQRVQQSAVKIFASKQEIPCLQPKNLKDPSFIEELKSYQADLQIVVAFRMLPEVVWNMPAMGTMNLHASLLPAYRGAAPINWAIINGEEKSGVSTFLLKHKIDTGEIIKRREIAIDARETAGSLHDKLMHAGAQLLVESAKELANGSTEPIPQTNFIPKGQSLSDFPIAPKIFREDCKVDWSRDLKKVDQKIRGLSPYPAAWTMIFRKSDGKQFNLKIYNCLPTNMDTKNTGEILGKDYQLFIGCGDRQLEILELQMEGKKRMTARDFLNGIHLEDYESILS